MKCLQRQHENRPQAKFCERCSSPLTSRHAPLGKRDQVTVLVGTQDMRVPFRDVRRRFVQRVSTGA